MQKILYRAVLSNVEPSIANLKLNHGFQFKALSDDEACDQIARLENRSKREILRRCLVGVALILLKDEL